MKTEIHSFEHHDLADCLALVQQVEAEVDLVELLTGRLKLDEINVGFDLLHEGKAIRQVVVFE